MADKAEESSVEFDLRSLIDSWGRALELLGQFVSDAKEALGIPDADLAEIGVDIEDMVSDSLVEQENSEADGEVAREAKEFSDAISAIRRTNISSNGKSSKENFCEKAGVAPRLMTGDEPMNELTNEEAIVCLKYLKRSVQRGSNLETAINRAILALRADDGTRDGMWLVQSKTTAVGSDRYRLRCSNCRNSAYNSDSTGYYLRYCSFCGSRMRNYKEFE